MTQTTAIARLTDMHPAAQDLRSHDAAARTRKLMEAHEAKLGRKMGWLEGYRWLMENGIRG